MWVKCKDGQTANLQIYHNGRRTRKSLGLVLLDNPKSPLERQNNTKIKQIAEERRSKMYMSLLEGESIERKKTTITLFKLIGIYIDKAQTYNTKKSYRCLISMLEKICKDYNINQIRREDISKICESMMKYNISDNSKRIYLNRLSTILRFAHDEYNIPDFTKFISKVKATTPPPYALTRDELKELFEDFKKEPCNYKSMFMFSAFTGLRYSDVIALRWVDIVNDSITINMKKTREPICVPVGQSAKEVLGLINANDDDVFEVVSVSHLNKSLKKWYKDVFGKQNLKIHFHTARHTFATLSLEAGADITTISNLLGHKSLSTTMVYTTITDKRKADAIIGFEEYLTR